MWNVVKLLLLACYGLVLTESPLQAYLDPGSGSMMLQLLLGGVAALGVIGRLYWRRFLSLFGRQGRDTHPR